MSASDQQPASPTSASTQRLPADPVQSSSSGLTENSLDKVYGPADSAALSLDRRGQELAARLAKTHQRIQRGLAAASRSDTPTLVVVTKYFPVADVLRLYHLGVRDFGENKAQDLSAKAQQTADLPGIRWHFIGQIQSNKTALIAAHADVVHSIDRVKLIGRLNQARAEKRSALDCLIQLNMDPEQQHNRGGVRPERWAEIGEAITAAEHIDLAGVMAVAPAGTDPAPAFAQVQRYADQLRGRYPQADAISAGMSGDLEQALAYGATHLRIGSDILGPRRSAG